MATRFHLVRQISQGVPYFDGFVVFASGADKEDAICNNEKDRITLVVVECGRYSTLDGESWCFSLSGRSTYRCQSRGRGAGDALDVCTVLDGRTLSCTPR